MHDHLETPDLRCSVDNTPLNPERDSSYGFNPVVAGGQAAEVESPLETMLLADKGEANPLYLVPPFGSWAAAKPTDSSKQTPGNLAYRHGESAGVLFVDGHAGTYSRDTDMKQAAVWGGQLLRRRLTDQVLNSYPVMVEVRQEISSGHESGAGRLLKSHKKLVSEAYNKAKALWPADQTDERERSLSAWGWLVWTAPAAVAPAPRPADLSYTAQPYLDVYPVNWELSSFELSGFTPQQLRLMRNAIYARHGRPFHDDDLREFFSQQSWYRADPSWHTPQDDDWRVTGLDRKNAEILLRREKATALE